MLQTYPAVCCLHNIGVKTLQTMLTKKEPGQQHTSIKLSSFGQTTHIIERLLLILQLTWQPSDPP